MFVFRLFLLPHVACLPLLLLTHTVLSLQGSPETPFSGVHQKSLLPPLCSTVFCSSLAQCVRQICLTCKTVSSLGASGGQSLFISDSVTAWSLVGAQ